MVIIMVYRTEHPDPQWEREGYINLNGEWDFDFYTENTPEIIESLKTAPLTKKITVPFCPESELSGIGFKDFISVAVYKRNINITAEQLENNIFLHFGAVDFKTTVLVNGAQVGIHIGGYSSFEFNIAPFLKTGENEILVIAEDDVKNKEQPSGKQSAKPVSYECYYTRTTGIWQTVWLEIVPKAYIKSAKYYPDVNNGSVLILGEVCGNGEIVITASYKGKPMGSSKLQVNGNNFSACLRLDEIHLWEVGNGRLYDLEFTFGEDRVKSYFGLRNAYLDGKKFMLNSECVFQRLVLDQGFYPDGIYTAKTDEALANDIKISMAAGFNGARLHQKVFEKRFLYHCDKAGYMVWGEHGNWGMDYTNAIACENFICEWVEIVERDFNHPSIIGWCPFNETWGYREYAVSDRIIESVYKITKATDSTRPCIAVSGNYHINGMEIYDVHDYCNSLDTFKEGYAHIKEGIVTDQVARREGNIQKYSGQPVFVSEYGGFALIADGEKGWGYGSAPKNVEELLERYTNYTDALLDNPDIMGFCYTQLYDVEQEKNGLYTYNRIPKLDMQKIKAVNTRKAKIEEQI